MVDIFTCCWLTVVLGRFSPLSVLSHDTWFVDLPWALRVFLPFSRSTTILATAVESGQLFSLPCICTRVTGWHRLAACIQAIGRYFSLYGIPRHLVPPVATGVLSSIVNGAEHESVCSCACSVQIIVKWCRTYLRRQLYSVEVYCQYVSVATKM
jgi:hypothetical protein